MRSALNLRICTALHSSTGEALSLPTASRWTDTRFVDLGLVPGPLCHADGVRQLLWPPHWHGRIATVLGSLTALFGFGSASSWPGTNNGNNLNAFLVYLFVISATVAFIALLAYRADQRYPQATFFEAVLRLFAPYAVIYFVCVWLINQGIFTNESLAFIPIAVFCVFAVGVLGFAVKRTGTGNAGVFMDTASEPQQPASPPFDPSAPPAWPTAPPSGPSAGYQAPAWTPTPPAPPETGSSYAHLTTSIVLAVGWLPLGFIFWFLLNWCPNEGTEGATQTASVLYVFAQIVGNLAIGALLDRRYGRAGGIMLAVGRSMLAGAVLAVALFFVILPFITGGTSRYCG